MPRDLVSQSTQLLIKAADRITLLLEKENLTRGEGCKIKLGGGKRWPASIFRMSRFRDKTTTKLVEKTPCLTIILHTRAFNPQAHYYGGIKWRRDFGAWHSPPPVLPPSPSPSVLHSLLLYPCRRPRPTWMPIRARAPRPPEGISPWGPSPPSALSSLQRCNFPSDCVGLSLSAEQMPMMAVGHGRSWSDVWPERLFVLSQRCTLPQVLITDIPKKSWAATSFF